MALSGGTGSPRKPWEGARNSASGPSIFKPSSGVNSTAAVVESAGVSDPPDKNASATPLQNGAIVNRPPMQVRGYGGTGYPMSNYNQYSGNGASGYTGYGTNGYTTNSAYGGAYNNYNRGYGGYGLASGTYGGGYGLGSPYGGSYGGGLYGNSYGGGMYGGAYGMGMGMGVGMGGPGSFQNGPGDPNSPFDDSHPAGPPSFWQTMLKNMHWVVMVFGHVATLVAENTQTFHILSTALFQFFERSGMLYGELARFVLKLLRMWSRPKLQTKSSAIALTLPPGAKNPASLRIEEIEGPKGSGGWDNVWSGDRSNMAS